MRRWMALCGLVLACACGGGGPTAPTPDFVGNYTFVVVASSVCQLPVSRFDWDLVATAAGGGGQGGSGQLGSFRLTLPGGDPTLSLNLAYQQAGGRRGGKGQGGTSLSIAVNAQAVPFGETLEVTITGATRGTASVAEDGRGQIVDGSINGTLRLSEPAPRGRSEVGRCTAGDHKFTLTPR